MEISFNIVFWPHDPIGIPKTLKIVYRVARICKSYGWKIPKSLVRPNQGSGCHIGFTYLGAVSDKRLVWRTFFWFSKIMGHVNLKPRNSWSGGGYWPTQALCWTEIKLNMTWHEQLNIFEAQNDTFSIKKHPKIPLLKKISHFDLSGHQVDTISRMTRVTFWKRETTLF